MLTTELLEVIKRFITNTYTLIYSSTLDYQSHQTQRRVVDITRIPSYHREIDDLDKKSSVTSRYLLCRVCLETLLMCCTTPDDQLFLDNFLQLNDVYRKLALIIKSTIPFLDVELLNILSFSELHDFHPRDPTYPGKIVSRALDFRFRICHSIYKLFDYGEKEYGIEKRNEKITLF